MTYWGRKCVSHHWLWCSGPIETCLRQFQHRWVTQIDFLLQDFCTKPWDFDGFRVFIRISLYYNLYQMKLKVITHPQCGLHFFKRPLVFLLSSYKVFASRLDFKRSYWRRNAEGAMKKRRLKCRCIMTLIFRLQRP